MATYSKETALYDTNGIKNDLDDAATKATNYLTNISGTNGISVHDVSDEKNFVNINSSDGVTIYKNIDGTATDVANFGETARIGQENQARLELNEGGIIGYSPDSVPYFNIDYDSGTTITEVTKILGSISINGYRIQEGTGIPPMSDTYLIEDKSIDLPSGAVEISIPASTSFFVYIISPPGEEVRSINLSSNIGYILREVPDYMLRFTELFWDAPVLLTYGTAISDIIKTCVINAGFSDSTSGTFGVRQIISFDGQTVRLRTYVCSTITMVPGDNSELRTYAKLNYTDIVNAASFVFGTNNDSLGTYSCSLGEGLLANAANQFVIGKFNESDNSKALIIGKGTSDSARSNGFTVDWSGRIEAGDYSGNLKTIFDIFYPVGSYYETSKPQSEFDPNDAWGGTWILETQGQVHVSAGSSYTVSGANTNTTDGGAATVTLTAAQSGIRAHAHPLGYDSGYSTVVSNTDLGENKVTKGSTTTSQFVYKDSASGDVKRSGKTSTNNNTAYDASSAHENMPPYIVVYRWHRTA